MSRKTRLFLLLLVAFALPMAGCIVENDDDNGDGTTVVEEDDDGGDTFIDNDDGDGDTDVFVDNDDGGSDGTN